MTQNTRPYWQKEVESDIQHGHYDAAKDNCWRYETRPMGGGNPYQACIGCGITDPAINGRISGHGANCSEMARKADEHALYDLRRQVLEMADNVPEDVGEALREEISRLCDLDKYDEGYVQPALAIQEMNMLYMLAKQEIEASGPRPGP